MFDGIYQEKSGFSMAMLVYRRVPSFFMVWGPRVVTKWLSNDLHLFEHIFSSIGREWCFVKIDLWIDVPFFLCLLIVRSTFLGECRWSWYTHLRMYQLAHEAYLGKGSTDMVEQVIWLQLSCCPWQKSRCFTFLFRSFSVDEGSWSNESGKKNTQYTNRALVLFSCTENVQWTWIAFPSRNMETCNMSLSKMGLFPGLRSSTLTKRATWWTFPFKKLAPFPFQRISDSPRSCRCFCPSITSLNLIGLKKTGS